jgi:hypothetical protein
VKSTLVRAEPDSQPNAPAGSTGRTRLKIATWLARIASFAVLVAAAAAMLWPAPVDSHKLPAADSTSDLALSHWTNALFIKNAVAETHRLPLWNPHIGGGRPTGADPLAALFYPPTQMVHALSVRDYLMLVLIGHLVFAGVGTFLLARRALALGRVPSLVAATSYMLTPRLIAHLGFGHLTIVQTVAWYPWIAIGAWETVRDPRRYAVPFGLALGISALAGHPQMAYYGGLMTLGISAYQLVGRWHRDGRSALAQSAVGLGVAGLIGVSVAAVHLIPLLEFTARSTRQESMRSADRYPFWEFADALVGLQSSSPIPHEGMLQPGLAVLALAALAVVARPRTAVPILAGVVVVALFTMGQASIVFRVAASILPEFDHFRGLARIWFVALLGIALLAGAGADALLRRARRISPRGASLIAVGLLVGVTWSLLHSNSGAARVGDIDYLATPFEFESLAVKHADGGRIYGVQRNMQQWNSVRLDVDLVDAWDPLLISRVAEFVEVAGGYEYDGYQLSIPPFEVYDPGYSTTIDAQPNAKLLGLLNVTVVISRTELDDPAFVQVGEANATRIYENTAAAGQGYLIVAGPDGSLPKLEDVQTHAITMHMSDLDLDRYEFDFTASTHGYFVIAAPLFPGWEARLDGHAVDIEQLGHVLPAVKVDPGPHVLTYEYRPASVGIGSAISGVTLMLSALWIAIEVWRQYIAPVQTRLRHWIPSPTSPCRTSGTASNRDRRPVAGD